MFRKPDCPDRQKSSFVSRKGPGNEAFPLAQPLAADLWSGSQSELLRNPSCGQQNRRLVSSGSAAIRQGRLGLTPGANIGEAGAIFEPIHGSAPDIAGQHKIKAAGTMYLRVPAVFYSASASFVSGGALSANSGGTMLTASCSSRVRLLYHSSHSTVSSETTSRLSTCPSYQTSSSRRSKIHHSFS
ncbi:MAG: hypothetical protein HFE60_03875 [Anaerotignum sp.]|nr:hypothetical protein [Anaerotignum sp.]